MKPLASGDRASGALTLTERERETLRLLLRGHDAKSIARDLGLSVHTINERLREARRKLGVTSSREAARRLVEIEQDAPNFLRDKEIGLAAAAPGASVGERAGQSPSASHRLAWLSAGMLIMSLIIAALALALALAVRGGGSAGTGSSPLAASTAGLGRVSDAGGIDAARAWVALVDGGRWEPSWTTASIVFKAHISASQWAQIIQPIRQRLGPVSSRGVQSVTTTDAPPGGPPGESETIKFQTHFANRPAAIETVSLAHERTGWRVQGYFIN